MAAEIPVVKEIPQLTYGRGILFLLGHSAIMHHLRTRRHRTLGLVNVFCATIRTMDIQSELAGSFKGELDVTDSVREFYSHDASLFELKPEVVGFPKDSKDLQAVVQFVNKHKKKFPELNITPRSRGTDMSGAAIGDSILLDVSKHMNKLLAVSKAEATVQPGMMYRDFEAETLKKGALLPSYPASRELASVGGMVSNNSGGEKSLEYGKTDKFVTELKVILSDGNEYTLKPLTRTQLIKKMSQKDFEGKLYKETFELLEEHYDEIQAAAPHVTKDSTGYHLWNVWNRETGIFDLTKLFVGAQGTLGLISEATVNLVPHKPHSGLLVLFLRDIDDLGELIPAVLKHKPATFESFDDQTLLLSIKFMPSFLKMLGLKKFSSSDLSLIPDGLQLLHGIPKLVLMVEFNGETEDEVRKKVHALHQELQKKRARYEINGFEETPTEHASEKFWVMRRNSFQLLRSKVKDKHTAPFIDDFVVPPQHLSVFLPKLRKIIKK
ncbi:TPA: FAD-binding oxidoreductase [Candidatus Saccharibacteria bacterium]|nr:FAD-binding oxidoreductase [Candidatus Saccharibacteria bacterium]